MSKKLSTLRILKGLRKLFAADTAWTQLVGAAKQQYSRTPTPIQSSEATCFCLTGAIAKVNGLDSWSDAVDCKAGKILTGLAGQHFVDWNDAKGRSIHDVRNLVDKAIAKVEAAQ